MAYTYPNVTRFGYLPRRLGINIASLDDGQDIATDSYKLEFFYPAPDPVSGTNAIIHSVPAGSRSLLVLKSIRFVYGLPTSDGSLQFSVIRSRFNTDTDRLEAIRCCDVQTVEAATTNAGQYYEVDTGEIYTDITFNPLVDYVSVPIDWTNDPNGIFYFNVILTFDTTTLNDYSYSEDEILDDPLGSALPL